MAQILSNLPVGAKVKFGKYSVNGETAQPITWLIVAKNHRHIYGGSKYPDNAITLLTEKLIDTRPFDAAEPNNTNANRRDWGNNNYEVSNIDQWLNKDNGAGEWYVAAHSVDQAPNPTYTNTQTAYANRPGFLNAFSSDEKNAILNSSIGYQRFFTDVSGSQVTTASLVRKVFIPSRYDVSDANSQMWEGETWEYFVNNPSLVTSFTEQALAYSQSTIMKPQWWIRTHNGGNPHQVFTFEGTGAMTGMQVRDAMGVRPALNLAANTPVSDTTDSEGCYTVTFNTVPSAPTTLTIPTIYGGKANTISWSSVTDPDGDSITYQLECSYDGSTFSQIYSGVSTVYSHSVTFGTVPMAYRVKATDSKGGSSEYAVAAVPMVVNNLVPVISGTDSNLGIKSAEFTETYTITDTDSETVTVTEAVDGSPIRSYVATLGKTNTVSVTGTTWLSLANGVHTLTISATDGIDTTVRTYTFTKSVSTLSIQTKVPMESSTMPTRISIQVTRNIPTDAIFKVEVCNNGFDSSPTWEDATSSVTGIAVHLFENTKKTATKWGVLIRVTVNRNGGEGACYVSAIGGNFE